MFTYTPPPTDYDRFEPRETIAAAPDHLARAFGNPQRPGYTPHPIAQNLDLPTIAHAFGRANQRPGAASSSTQSVIGQGLASNGFIKLVQEATAPVIARAYNAAGEQRPFAAVLPMSDYRAQPIYGLDLAHGLEAVPEAGKIPRRPAFSADAVHGVASVGTYAQIFEVTRGDLLANDTASLINLLTGAGALAVQTEVALLANAIEGATALSDGAVFDASNTLAQPLTAEHLATAVGMLRNQGAPGRPLNIAPRHLAVEPALELPARKLVRDADLSGALIVTAVPGLAAGRWLLFGAPEHLPSLTLFQIEGRTLSYTVQRSFKTDGLDLAVAITAGAGFVGRIGIVKGGA